jgi:hypothetical protein
VAVLAVVLLAVLVGAAVPVLVQWRATLRAVQRFFDDNGPRAARCMDEVSAAAEHLNERSRGTERLGATLLSAVIPAAVAALEVLRGESPGKPEKEPEEVGSCEREKDSAAVSW